MATLTDEQLDCLGQLSDTADNLIAASKLPVPASTHIEGMTGGLRKIRDEIRALVVEASRENPWEGSPLS